MALERLLINFRKDLVFEVLFFGSNFLDKTALPIIPVHVIL